MKFVKGFAPVLMLAFMLAPASVKAVPFTYEISGTFDSFNIPGMAAGYTATLVLDNGGATNQSQTYNPADFVSFDVVSGSYTFTGTDLLPGAQFTMATDLNGDFNTNNIDLIVEGIEFPTAGGNPLWEIGGSFNLDGGLFVNGAGPGEFGLDSDFTIAQAQTSIPEPAALALLGLGIVGLGFARRRRAA